MHVRNKSFGFVRHSIWHVRTTLIAVTLHVIFLPKRAITTAAVFDSNKSGFSPEALLNAPFLSGQL